MLTKTSFTNGISHPVKQEFDLHWYFSLASSSLWSSTQWSCPACMVD